jgi:hypothetical protein
MQDLGKITVDVVTGMGGGGSGVGGEEEAADKLGLGEILKALPGMFSSMKGNGFDFSATLAEMDDALEDSGSRFGSMLIKATAGLAMATVVVGAITKAFKMAIDAVMRLHQFIMGVASDLREFSPAIQIADMTNEIAMTMEKLRLGGIAGPAIAAQIQQAGRIERSLLTIKSFAAGVGAAFLAPMTEALAKILEAIVGFLPKILEALPEIVDDTADFMQRMGAGLLSSGLSFGGIGAGMIMLGGVVKTQVVPLVQQLVRNTQPQYDFTAANEPFVNDLRLMGAKI